ncbi:MAG: apolipoprotein N-acyltransferase [Bacteroidia bacterium]
MIFRHPLFLVLLSGMLFAFSWPETGGLTFPVFVAFVPLLLAERQIALSNTRFRSFKIFLLAYIAFFIWNLITTWWVKNASFGGAVMAVVFNTLFMATVFWAYHRVMKRLPLRLAFFVLTSFWMAFEFLHLRWDLTWPWLTLGNVFANKIWMIQWYEYTGVFGGTLWIFLINFMVFQFLMKNRERSTPEMKRKMQRKGLLRISLVLLIPVLYSVQKQMGVVSWNVKYSKEPEVVIVQPNIDPYHEKFNGSYKDQLGRMMELAETKIDSTTACVVFPETAIQENLWENDMERSYSIHMLRYFQDKHPGLDIVIGAASGYQYMPGEKKSPTARKFTDSENYYEDYNTAVMLSGKGPLQLYHKSKFVPGSERMPFPALLKPLEKYAIDLGGTTGSLGEQDERSVFVSNQKNGLKIAPVICYESVFGEYVTDYIKKGANVIFIITNDGWWGDTPGYHQHLAYARLRAIETRRCIARSANTGVSCFINEGGDVSQATSWWVPAAIKGKITLQDKLTFYVRHGDYIARAFMAAGLILLLWSLSLMIRGINKH